MNSVTFEGPLEDKPFFDYLRDEGYPIEITMNDSFEGLSEFIQAVLPLKEIIVPVAIAYIVASKDRAIIINGKKIIYKGYNLKEVVKHLKEVVGKTKEK